MTTTIRKGFRMKVTGSKNIAAIDFTEGEGLKVQFQNGRTYQYPTATEEVYDELVKEVQSTSAEASVGKAFNRLVRAAGLEYEEISPV